MNTNDQINKVEEVGAINKSKHSSIKENSSENELGQGKKNKKKKKPKEE